MIVELSKHNPVASLLFLFKGPPTSGKTEAIFGFPRPIWIADLDDKVEVIMKGRSPKELEGIFVEKFSPGEFEAFRTAVHAAFKDPKYKTRCIDSLTSLSRIILKYSVAQKSLVNAQLKPGEDTKGKNRGVIEQTALDDYGVEADGLLEILDYLRNHVSGYRILTAHETPVEIKDVSGKVLSTVWQLLTGGSKIARRIPSFFKEIYQFDVRKNITGGGKYIVTTKNDGEHFANTILPLPTEMEWTGKNFFDLLKAECLKKGITL